MGLNLILDYKKQTYRSRSYSTAVEMNGLRELVEDIAKGQVKYLKFDDSNGNTHHFPNKILKKSILSILPG